MNKTEKGGGEAEPDFTSPDFLLRLSDLSAGCSSGVKAGKSYPGVLFSDRRKE